MTINFNNVRKQACIAYDRLCKELNDAILKESSDQYAIPNDCTHGQQMNITGYILIEANYIQSQMDDLRAMIGTIASTYEEGNENFADVYPTDKQMIHFNDSED